MSMALSGVIAATAASWTGVGSQPLATTTTLTLAVPPPAEPDAPERVFTIVVLA
jgi:hypothetical protein